MKMKSLDGVAADDLVADYTEIGILQHDALWYHDTDEFNELFDERHAIEQELKSRPGDQRHLLLPLLAHENVQVRLNAVRDTLAIDPTAARYVLEDLANLAPHVVQGVEASMTIDHLDSGFWVPN